MVRTQQIRTDILVGGRWVSKVVVLAFVMALVVVMGYSKEAYAAPGDLDTSFGSGGKVITNFAGSSSGGRALAVQDDDKVVVAGSAFVTTTGDDFALARYNPNGTLDTTFSGDGKVTTPIGANDARDKIYSVAVGADGKIIVAGSTFTNLGGSSGCCYDFAVARYNPNGTLDTTFSGDGKVITLTSSGNNEAYGVAVQGTKIIVVGYSDQGDPASGGTGDDFTVVRYDSNGNLDPTFSGDGKLTTDFGGFQIGGESDDAANSVVLQPDGKIVAAGRATYTHDTGFIYQDFAVARYDSSGNLDTSFAHFGQTTTNLDGIDEAYSVALQEDGKIVAGGIMESGETRDFALVRYNPNGNLNTEFGSGGTVITDFSGWDDEVRSVAIQDNGRIVAAGTSTCDFALARYNSDGTPNNTFSNDAKVKTDFGGCEDASGIGLQTDGNIVAAGGSSAESGPFGYDFAVARYYGGTDDVTPPKVSRPSHTLLSPTTVGTTDVPIRLTWSATDAQGDVTRYQLQRSTNGGPYTNVALPSPTTTVFDQYLTPNFNYRYRVRATDDSGNTSLYKYGPRFTMGAHQESSTAITYSASTAWTQEALSGSYGGQVKFATAAGSTATLSFVGTNVAWVAPKSPERGQAEVYLDNVKVATVDLSSTSPLSRQMVYAANGLNPSVAHTLQVKVLGTANRPRVDVDAFVVVR